MLITQWAEITEEERHWWLRLILFVDNLGLYKGAFVCLFICFNFIHEYNLFWSDSATLCSLSSPLELLSNSLPTQAPFLWLPDCNFNLSPDLSFSQTNTYMQTDIPPPPIQYCFVFYDIGFHHNTKTKFYSYKGYM